MTEMLGIPRGETKSYGEIAENLDSAAIAVGQACGRNPLPVIVPCHRVVGKNSLGGYCGKKSSDPKRKELEAADF
ncbi:MAG: methylated-DNA--[protein]-cysteine S-methyltransferase [Candidatus Nanosalina sp.]